MHSVHSIFLFKVKLGQLMEPISYAVPLLLRGMYLTTEIVPCQIVPCPRISWFGVLLI
ncbi:hypothetical protein PAXRUDRAFT_768093 [Paxillus rubicundulus Ve08.2h10]|uniref:Uncharacterized protein n=1 Tax=Paxillus rubicundulus Ve08.2h10 TaxID=930991 RepID=A0A0D0CA67_9AGAM|nr:hypothetical protein PAXRUDRAFT_768093 [Paxillus rubicundulus Ve08.2h10]